MKRVYSRGDRGLLTVEDQTPFTPDPKHFPTIFDSLHFVSLLAKKRFRFGSHLYLKHLAIVLHVISSFLSLYVPPDTLYREPVSRNELDAELYIFTKDLVLIIDVHVCKSTTNLANGVFRPLCELI